MQKTPYQIIEIVQKLKDGQPSRRYKVRAVLKWFGAKRRGDAILKDILDMFVRYDLSTEPQFDKVGIDNHVRFALAIAAATNGHPASQESDGSHDSEGGAFVQPATQNEQIPPSASPSTQETAASGGHAEATAAPTEDQLEPENGDEIPVTKPDDHPVTSQICDWTISALTDKLNRGNLELQPKFQREYVWSLRPELPSRLIESLLLRIPIPPIYLGKMPGGRHEVIDGQQRLTTLVKFVRNEFSLCKLLRMGSLNGKLFKDLSPEQQELILDEPIRTIVIDSAGNSDLRYEVFERLNRGSMALNEQELRNCVYRGPFNDLLAELEQDPVWRKVKGGIEPEWRFKEREMILRFFAFANRLPQYNGGLKAFLNEYMADYSPRKEADLKTHAALFRQTMQNVYTVFGPNSARYYDVNPRTNNGDWDTKFSITVLDIQAAALINRPPAKVQQVAEQIRELFLFTMLTDVEMQDAISRRTGSSVQTRIRFTKFRQLVDPIIDGAQVEPRFFDYVYRKELWNKSHVCELCNNEIHLFGDSTVDHIFPYSKGGKTVSENGQLAHRGCNARKNAQMPNAQTAGTSLIAQA
jgi:5-methylcytosine-specific restriction endonuclease McrA